MKSALKSFGISIIVSLIIFVTIALISLGIIVDKMGLKGDGFLSTTKIETKVSNEDNNNSENVENALTDIHGKTFTLLLAGTDYQPDIFNDYDLSSVNSSRKGFPLKERAICVDSITVVHVNKEKGTIVFCSLPSNMKITLDGISTTLDNVYSKKGATGLCEKVSSAIGIKVDYYAITTISNMKKMIDSIEGIIIDVPERMEYSDSSQNLTINLYSGEQTLYGDKLLQLLRYNNYKSSENSRIKTSIAVIKAIISKLTDAQYYEQAHNLLKQFSQYTETNINDEALTDNIELIFSYSKFEIADYTYPGTKVNSDGVELFEPSMQTARNYFEEYKYQGK